MDQQPGHEALLVDAHRGRLLRLCRLLLRNPEEAHDVVQDVFVKAYDAQLRGRAPSDWATWLTRVAVNACHDRRRAGWWRQVPVRSLQDPVVSTAMTDLTAALFSVDGEPRRRTAPLVPDMTQEAGCETVTQMAGLHCADGLLGLGEGMGAPGFETQAEGVSP